MGHALSMIAEKPLPNGSGMQYPNTIVIHAMGEIIRYQGQDLFAHELLAKLGLSAHASALPSGVVVRMRPDNLIAYHAKGRNLNSLGFEFLVGGVHDLDSLQATTATHYLTDAQYNAGVDFVRAWKRKYNIKNVVQHSEIDPERRWYDPGRGFPWDQFLSDIRG